MSDSIDIIKKHLHENGLNYIQVANSLTEKILHKALYLDEIKKEFGTIDDFFTHLLKQGISKLQIQRRKKQGSSSRPIGLAMPLALSSATEEPQPQPNQGLQSANQNYNGNMNDVVQMQPSNHFQTMTQELVYKQRIGDLEEKVIEYKQLLAEERDDKRQINRKLQDAYDEIRELKVSCATAEKEKDLALREQKVEQTNFLDSQFAQEGLKGVFGMVNGKNGNGNGEQSQLAGAQVSTRKQALLQWIMNDSVTDDICDKLYAVSVGIFTKPEDFTPELQQLLDKYELKTT